MGYPPQAKPMGMAPNPYYQQPPATTVVVTKGHGHHHKHHKKHKKHKKMKFGKMKMKKWF